MPSHKSTNHMQFQEAWSAQRQTSPLEYCLFSNKNHNSAGCTTSLHFIWGSLRLHCVFKLVFRSGLLNSWAHVLVLQELFAVQSSSSEAESSLETLPPITGLQKDKEWIVKNTTETPTEERCDKLKLKNVHTMKVLSFADRHVRFDMSVFLDNLIALSK